MCTIKSVKLHITLCQQCRHVLYPMSYTIFNLSALQRSSAIQIGRVMDRILPGGLRGMALSTRQSVVAKIWRLPMMNLKPGCGSKELAAPNDELETWKETILLPTLARY